ncbi:MAG: hypothetical protein IJK48_05740 [Bacteroidales bacterium]|nr:hypothetical protein [Bacteroidales bacterium]
MKRDLTNSRTYLPPRVRVVEAYSENSALAAFSQVNINSQFSVDELEIKAFGDEDEQYWFE